MEYYKSFDIKSRVCIIVVSNRREEVRRDIMTRLLIGFLFVALSCAVYGEIQPTHSFEPIQQIEHPTIPFPHCPNKASYSSLHTPKGVLDYYKKTGKYPTLPPPTTLILCYNEAMVQYLVQKYRHQSCDGCFSEVIYLLDYPGVALACFGIGAPTNAMKIDTAIEWGVKQFISIGTACTIQRGLSLGDLIVCDRAIRDEGISHHYLPYAKYAFASRDLTGKIISVLKGMNKSFHVGTSLTSDAFYKIGKEEVKYFQRDGVLCAEMEAAAEFAVVSLHEEIKIAAIFTLMSDSYANLEWERPVFDKEKKKEAFDFLLTVALHTALGTVKE